MKRETLGEKLKEARLKKQMTQKEVVGDFITRNMLSQIESGAATPSIQTLEYLASVLDLSMGYLLDTENSVQLPEESVNAGDLFKKKDYSGVIRALEGRKGISAEERFFLTVSFQKAAEKEKNPVSAAGYAKKSLGCNTGEFRLDGYALRSCELLVRLGVMEVAGELEGLASKYSGSEAYLVASGFRFIEEGDYESLDSTVEALRKASPGGLFGGCLQLFEGALKEKDSPNLAAADYRLALNAFLNENAPAFYLEKIYTLLEHAALRTDDYRAAHLYSSERLKVIESDKG